ncbi:MAG: L-Lys-D/L-Arg epimerase [Alphaproteobacteria bacterium MarineAlpha3_Bin1]|nr:MAG: L-Lys-D/L-Arg epimerase [Alphaproteobacteria bacterium MarineAlpha3_Bin1]
MIILEIRLLRIKLPLITPYRLSYRTVEAFEPLLVEVRDADGNAGWGEGHISPGSSDETPEGGWAFCHNIAATAAGHDSDAIKASLLDSMAVSPVAAGAFVSAIDMLTGDPLLRPPAEETRLPILAPVNGLTPEALGPEIEEKLASGFRTFKIKVGKDLDGDIARTRTIQDTIAGRATMRIDANRAFSEDQAKQFAAADDSSSKVIHVPLGCLMKVRAFHMQMMEPKHAHLRWICDCMVALTTDNSVPSVAERPPHSTPLE